MFPSPRGVGADLTWKPVKSMKYAMVSVPSRGWGRSHYREHVEVSGSVIVFPSPRGVGADLTEIIEIANEETGESFRPLAGLGQISPY